MLSSINSYLYSLHVLVYYWCDQFNKPQVTLVALHSPFHL